MNSDNADIYSASECKGRHFYRVRTVNISHEIRETQKRLIFRLGHSSYIGLYPVIIKGDIYGYTALRIEISPVVIGIKLPPVAYRKHVKRSVKADDIICARLFGQAFKFLFRHGASVAFYNDQSAFHGRKHIILIKKQYSYIRPEGRKQEKENRRGHKQKKADKYGKSGL